MTGDQATGHLTADLLGELLDQASPITSAGALAGEDLGIDHQGGGDIRVTLYDAEENELDHRTFRLVETR